MQNDDQRRSATGDGRQMQGHGPFERHEREAIEHKTPSTPPAVFEVIRRAGEMELRDAAAGTTAAADAMTPAAMITEGSCHA